MGNFVSRWFLLLGDLLHSWLETAYASQGFHLSESYSEFDPTPPEEIEDGFEILFSPELGISRVPRFNKDIFPPSDFFLDADYTVYPHLNPVTEKFYAESIIMDPRKRRSRPSYLTQLGPEYLDTPLDD